MLLVLTRLHNVHHVLLWLRENYQVQIVYARLDTMMMEAMNNAQPATLAATDVQLPVQPVHHVLVLTLDRK